jgi:Holliday junction DNA helicase RuvA
VIGRLRGVVAERGNDGSCVLDVGGVGYELFVPLGALARLPAAPGEVTLHVHTHVREEAFVLYGFAEPEDRAAFRAVLGVSGVGPKMALALLSTLSAGELAAAIASEDKSRFKGIPGVGKKTIERLLLELKDKLPTITGAPKAGRAPVVAGGNGALSAVASALVQMGYKPSEADRAVAKLADTKDKPVEALLREALNALG